MKKCLIALLALASVVLLSCGKEKKPSDSGKDNEDILEIVSFSFTADKGEGTLEIPLSTNGTVKVAVDPEAKNWLFHLETKAVSDHRVIMGYHANENPTPRTGKVTLTVGTKQAEVVVTQPGGDPSVSIETTSRKVNPRGEEFTVTVTSNDDVRANTQVSWIRVNGGNNKDFSVTVDINDTGYSREAEVSFYCSSNASIKTSLTISQKPANTDPASISILAIGNSFSDDATQYLYPILKQMGYTKIRLGNLYIGGCSLETHATNFINDNPNYTYRTNDSGVWVSKDNTAASVALEPDDWDYITLQQVSGYSGVSDSYEPHLNNLIEQIRKFCPFTPLVWHMTWAYQGDSNHADFAKYGNDQMEMYDNIVNAVQSKIVKSGKFEKVIPSGTAIQNLRTSFFEDNLTRDGYHLSYNIGRPVAALTWAKVLTGKSIDNVTYTPDDKNSSGTLLYKYEEDYLPAFKEAVDAACEKPFEVTESKDHLPHFTSFYDKDVAKSLISGLGYDPSDYLELRMGILHNSYWESTAAYTRRVAFLGSTGTTVNKFASTVKLHKSQIPVGSLIIVKNGFQYRPEGWQSLSANNTSERPSNVTASIVEVDAAWWGDFNYRGFNIAPTSGAILNLKQQDELDGVFGIFVPKSAIDLGDLENYGNENWNWN